jgi:hypothetical protein
MIPNAKQSFIDILMKITSLPMWLWIVVPVATPFLAFVIGMTLAFSNFFGLFDENFPTDAEMESKFYENRDVFGQLLQMSREDSIESRIIYNSARNNSSEYKPIELSEEKWQKYKDIFARLNLNRGMARDSSGSIYLYVYMSGGQKGYIYSKDNQEPVVNSLDDKSLLKKNAFASKKLDGNWYIYLGRL